MGSALPCSVPPSCPHTQPHITPGYRACSKPWGHQSLAPLRRGFLLWISLCSPKECIPCRADLGFFFYTPKLVHKVLSPSDQSGAPTHTERTGMEMTTGDPEGRGSWSWGTSVCCGSGVLSLSYPYRPTLGCTGVVPESRESFGGYEGGCSMKRKWKKVFQAYGRGRGKKTH